MKIRVSLEAKADMQDISRYIARDNPPAAKREIARIKEAIKILASEKVEGREVRLQDGRAVRVWFVSSYRLYYRRSTNELHVVRVYHQARRPIEQ